MRDDTHTPITRPSSTLGSEITTTGRTLLPWPLGSRTDSRTMSPRLSASTACASHHTFSSRPSSNHSGGGANCGNDRLNSSLDGAIMSTVACAASSIPQGSTRGRLNPRNAASLSLLRRQLARMPVHPAVLRFLGTAQFIGHSPLLVHRRPDAQHQIGLETARTVVSRTRMNDECALRS